MGLDVFDIVAVILGVIFTIRKLDAQRREPEEFAHVDRDEFLAWRRRETFVYSVGMMSCFGKVVAKVVVTSSQMANMAGASWRFLGAAIDIPWFLITIFVLVSGYRLALLRAKLRIVLGGFVVADESGLSKELKDAIAEINAAEYERAEYHLKQIALDADESLRGVAIYYMGECYRRQGRIDEAKDAFVESLEIDPSLRQPQEALEELRTQETGSSEA